MNIPQGRKTRQARLWALYQGLAGRRLLGFDLGQRRVGLALSDASMQIATPLTTIDLGRGSLGDRLAELRALCQTHAVGGLVFGCPLDLEGRQGRQGRSYARMAGDLSARLGLAYALWDERYSTQAAQRLLDAPGPGRPRRQARQRRAIDRMAATFMLQGVLDCLHVLSAQADTLSAQASGGGSADKAAILASSPGIEDAFPGTGAETKAGDDA